ncbi:MAG: SHOCT domain-containing protein [Thermodesulfobacteriota bacterium]
MIFKRKNKESDGIFKSIMAAYSILLLHVFLVAGIGFLVLFFSGIVNYMGWIFLIGASITLLLTYRHYRRMKNEGKTVGEMMKTSLLSGKTVELSLFGGLLSFRVGRSGELPAIENRQLRETLLLEDPHKNRIDELTELVRLLESGLITREEYDQAKKQVLSST